MPQQTFYRQARLHTHHFFDSKPQFVFTDSRFEHWVMVASEAGRFYYELDEQSGEMGFGEVLCVAPGSRFKRSVESETLTYHVLQWSLAAEKEAQPSAMWEPGSWILGDTARLLSDFAILRRLHYLLDPFSLQRREVVAQDILDLMWESRYIRPQITDPTMQEAAHLIRQKAGEMISINEIAGQMNLGAVQFTRRFREAHGLNPIEFLTRQRLEIAQKLLIETNQTIDEIATQCGWSHGSYLSRLFTSQFGLTPGAFRKLRRV